MSDVVTITGYEHEGFVFKREASNLFYWTAPVGPCSASLSFQEDEAQGWAWRVYSPTAGWVTCRTFYGTADKALADVVREMLELGIRPGTAAAVTPHAVQLDGAELGAVLAGLRLLQQRGCPDDLEDLATDAGLYDLPGDDFIDDLCEKLNGWNVSEDVEEDAETA